MTRNLAQVFDGWNGYQTSLLHAVAPLTAAQLSWRPAPDRRSVGELVRHISLGRITWYSRFGTPGWDEVALGVPHWHSDGDGSRNPVKERVPCDVNGQFGGSCPTTFTTAANSP